MKGSPERGITRAAVSVPGEETASSPNAACPIGFAVNHSTATRVETTAIAVRHFILLSRSGADQGAGSISTLLGNIVEGTASFLKERKVDVHVQQASL